MFIVAIHDLDNIKALKQAGADAVVIGVDGLSTVAPLMIDPGSLLAVACAVHKEGLQLLVNACRFFHEDHLDKVKDLLCTCKDAGIDGLYYGDDGLYPIAKDLQMEQLLIYQPETLVTNKEDLSFYLGLGIQSVCLGHECSLEEILQITETEKNAEILISGHFPIQYSGRKLLTNYLLHIRKDKPEQNSPYFIQEMTRKEHMPVVETQFGTFIFSAEPIQSAKQLPVFQEHGLTRFRIDPLFYDDAWTIRVLHAYQNHEEVPGSDFWYHQRSLLRKEASHE